MARIFRRFAALAALASIVAIIPTGVVPDSYQSTRYVVAAEASVTIDALARDLGAHRIDVTRRLDDLHALEVTVASSRFDEIARLGGVRYVEPVVSVALADAPSDPLYSKQNPYLQPVNAQQAWDIQKGNPGIIVAVVDTGVDVNHQDLRANIWTNPNEVPNNNWDDDGNGCVDDVNGCAFISDSSPGCQNITNGFIQDDIGHGTFVAGVIAAAGNTTGIVGVARNVRIMPIKVLDCYGSGDSIATARGILYAARHGARVINLSLGGLESAQVVTDAIIEAMNVHNAITVAATGNDGVPGVSFPARVAESLAVGAAGKNPDKRASFSSYGPEVDVVAVGEDVFGTVPATKCFVIVPCVNNEPYGPGNGTSFSTPQVSGLAALMLSQNPGLRPAQVADIIRNSATSLPADGAPNWAGAGRINMLAALQSVAGNRPPGEACVVESVQDGETFTCSGGRVVRMLQMDAPDLGQCGGQWAKDALANIFLTPGRTVYLRYDISRVDGQNRNLASPLWRGSDGNDYNISIVMVYVGLARAADIGANNAAFHDWSFASEMWAHTAAWNMWAPAKPFTGGC